VKQQDYKEHLQQHLLLLHLQHLQNKKVENHFHLDFLEKDLLAEYFLFHLHLNLQHLHHLNHH
jgi:ribosomal silencing factor RsfS